MHVVVGLIPQSAFVQKANAILNIIGLEIHKDKILIILVNKNIYATKTELGFLMPFINCIHYNEDSGLLFNVINLLLQKNHISISV